MCEYYLIHLRKWMLLGLYLSMNKPPWLNNCMCNQNLIVKGEIKVKKTKGAEVKVLFQGLNMTHVFLALVYNLKFYILDTPFSTAF